MLFRRGVGLSVRLNLKKKKTSGEVSDFIEPSGAKNTSRITNQSRAQIEEWDAIGRDAPSEVLYCSPNLEESSEGNSKCTQESISRMHQANSHFSGSFTLQTAFWWFVFHSGCTRLPLRSWWKGWDAENVPSCFTLYSNYFRGLIVIWYNWKEKGVSLTDPMYDLFKPIYINTIISPG